MKKILKWVSIILFIAIVLTVLYFAFAFLGNPVSWLLAKNSSSQYLKENFPETDFEISKVGYNFKTGGYYAKVVSPSSQDSYFTIYTNGWGQYEYDTYESITNGSNTLSRIDREYNDLVDSALAKGICPFDTSIVIGELRVAGLMEVYSYTDENGSTQHYTLYKDYGLDRSTLELDKEYDIYALGAAHGHITLYIHDPNLSVERTAELLLEVKEYLDEQNVPFHAIDFHLCEPRNEEGQNVGEQITLFEFLYGDIYEEGLIDRVQAHWDIAQEHYAIQDGLKNSQEHITSSLGEIIQ